MMHAPITPSKQIESFALSLSDIGQVDVDKLHALSLSVRWPHRAKDWELLCRVGTGFAASDDIGRVLATAMWFPQGERFASIGMVITSPRLQTHGAGLWLMHHALNELQGRDIGLNATWAAERLYLSLGFRREASVYQHQGRARETAPLPLPDGLSLRELTRDDAPQILDLDTRAAGYDRGALLAEILPSSTGFGLFGGDTLLAYALRRPFGRGTLIGPVVAASDHEAIAVVAPHIAAQSGTFVRLDTRRKTGDFSNSLSAAGLGLFDTVATMALGADWIAASLPPSAPAIYGLVTQATG